LTKKNKNPVEKNGLTHTLSINKKIIK